MTLSTTQLRPLLFPLIQKINKIFTALKLLQALFLPMSVVPMHFTFSCLGHLSTGNANTYKLLFPSEFYIPNKVGKAIFRIFLFHRKELASNNTCVSTYLNVFPRSGESVEVCVSGTLGRRRRNAFLEGCLLGERVLVSPTTRLPGPLVFPCLVHNTSRVSSSCPSSPDLI